MPEAGFPVNTGDFVNADWLNSMGLRWIADSSGLTLPAASITFASLPTTFTHLLLVYQARTNLAATSIDYLAYRVNGSSAATYYARELYGNNSALTAAEVIGATQGRCGYVAAVNSVANSFATGYAIFPQFQDPTVGLQSYVFGFGSSGLGYGTTAALTRTGTFNFYYGAPAMTSLQLFGAAGGSFITGTRFSLYGMT